MSLENRNASVLFWFFHLIFYSPLKWLGLKRLVAGLLVLHLLLELFIRPASLHLLQKMFDF